MAWDPHRPPEYNLDHTKPRPCAVYRLYNAEGALLYVGESFDPFARFKQHTKRWWGGDIRHKDITWFTNAFDAMAEEAKAIDTENPIHNGRPGIDRAVFVTVRDRSGPVKPVFDIRRVDFEQRMESVGYGRHMVAYYDGQPRAMVVPYDWYEKECERRGEPIDPEELRLADGSDS